MKLNILPENDTVKIQYTRNYNYSNDAGLDLLCIDQQTIQPGETAKVNLHIKCEAFEGTQAKSYYLYLRSSTAFRTPLRLANSVGIIDAGYRGDIMAIVDNRGNEPYTIEPGNRLFQLCSPTLDPIEFTIVDELSSTERGEGGFGSTNT